jgi:hypothetical protein
MDAMPIEIPMSFSEEIEKLTLNSYGRIKDPT